MASGRILLFVTGSIAAFKSAALASKLAQDGFDVRVVLSSGAREFVGGTTFEGLTRNRVYESTIAPGDAMAHIDLARWADLALVYPGSANTIAKFAHGLADDLLGALFLAFELRNPDSITQSSTERYGRPFWIAPAMNPAMLGHPATQESIEKLRGWGCRIVESDAGRMACGEVGVGRLPEPEAMLTEIRRFFANNERRGGGLSGRRIVVTAGGTSEPIDPVRVLTNTSTGETGARLANAFAEAGAETILLLSANSPFRREVSPRVRTETYETFADLDRAVARELADPVDFFVHAAAVSDYSIDRVESIDGRALSQTRKIHSGEGLRLVLRPNPKILERVREYAGNPALRIVSFKLSTAAEGEAADLSGYSSDWIVHNAVSGIERGSDRHRGEIFARESETISPSSQGRSVYRTIARFETKGELRDALVALLSQENRKDAVR